jgi:sec-independent protein translocase protein TatB
MFDFGFWEFAIIGIIIIVVVGQEKMPSLARKAGIYAGKLNKFITKIKYDIDEEIKVEELKEQLSFEDEKSTLLEVLDDVKVNSEDSKKEIDR